MAAGSGKTRLSFLYLGCNQVMNSKVRVPTGLF